MITRQSTLEQNKINGKLIERYFAAQLITALNARVSFTSRTDDDALLDLVTIMSHPWKRNAVEIFFTQVKSGYTYCSVVAGKLYVNKERLSNLLNRNRNSLICWAETDSETSHWFFIKANASFFKEEYNQSHILSPLTKYDLARLVTSANNKNGGKGLIFAGKAGYYEYDKPEHIRLRSQSKSCLCTLQTTRNRKPIIWVN